MATLSHDQFEQIRGLALRVAGLQLHERHRELLGRRSGRLGLGDGAGVDSLLQAVEEGEPAATQKLIGLVTTKFTEFFRHPRHFEAAAAHVRETVRRHGRARVWSAGAATGEEPYSLAMTLIEVIGRPDPPVEVLATDIDRQALDFAERGVYGEAALAALPPDRRRRFFSQAAETGRWSLAPEVRRLVDFRTLNLAEPGWPVEGPFDVVFCRNVMMYLQASHREAVLERLACRLVGGGLLLVDPVEQAGPSTRWFAPRGEGAYRRVTAASAPSPRARASARLEEGA